MYQISFSCSESSSWLRNPLLNLLLQSILCSIWCNFPLLWTGKQAVALMSCAVNTFGIFAYLDLWLRVVLSDSQYMESLIYWTDEQLYYWKNSYPWFVFISPHLLTQSPLCQFSWIRLEGKTGHFGRCFFQHLTYHITFIYKTLYRNILSMFPSNGNPTLHHCTGSKHDTGF